MAGTPRKVRLAGGREVALDGDLIPILEALYQEVAVASGFEHDYLQMRKEIEHVVAQLTPGELRDYFINSLFLNFVSYENEMAGRILSNLARTKAAKRAIGGTAGPGDPKRRASRPARARAR